MVNTTDLIKPGLVFKLGNSTPDSICKVVDYNKMSGDITFQHFAFGSTVHTVIVMKDKYLIPVMAIVPLRNIALEMLAYYYEDTSRCGVAEGSKKRCVYKTADGKQCIAGRAMHAHIPRHGSIAGILMTEPQKAVFKTFFVDLFEASQWSALQAVHDKLAVGDGFQEELLQLTGVLDLAITEHQLKDYITRGKRLWLPFEHS